MINLINKVKSAVCFYNMLNDCDSVTAGLSGGADSVALLYVLKELSEQYNLKIKAVHINHQLRGEESDRDENFCLELCKKLDIPFYSEKVNVKTYMNKYGVSLEESARILRYEIFAKYSEGGKTATAHTLSDNAETVIHNLARGTGLKGITGIPPVRDNIIRPLITVSRNEIEAYLKSKSQDFVTDSTNLTDDYTRNKIRHHIIPEIEKINNSFLKTMSANISAFHLENSFISEYSDDVYEKCLENSDTLKNLPKYHKAVRHRCIVRFLNEHNISYNNERINAIDNILKNNGKINVANNVYITSISGILSIESIFPENNNYDFCFGAGQGEFIISDNKLCNIKIISADEYTENPEWSAIDYKKTIGKIILRSRKNGDKIKLCGRNFTSSVKKSLINMKIPVEERSSLCFLEDDCGLIFAEKLGIAERVKPDKNTSEIMLISVSVK